MKNIFRATTSILLSLILIFDGAISASFAYSAEPSSEFVEGEVLVKFKPGISGSEIKEINSDLGGISASRANRTGIRKVRIPGGTDVLEAADEYQGDSRVEFAEPNYIRQVETAPNDIYYNSQWALAKIQAEPGWQVENGANKPVVVAVVDTGVDLNHPDLAEKTLPGYDFINSDSDPMDDNGHGTHVAGIIAAQTNNLIGVAGLSWGAKIMPIKALNASGVGTDISVANGIIWAADRGAKIINLSLGGTNFSATLQSAIAYAHNKGSVVVAAAGNEGEKGNPITYPAALNYVIAVAATDGNDQRASFSSFGSYVDLAAPGVAIISTQLDDVYSLKSGTSMAAPHVSGLAALILAKEPQLSPDEVEQRMKLNADDIEPVGRDDFYGYGRINIHRTLNQQPVLPAPGQNLPTAPGGASTGEIFGRVVDAAGQTISGTAIRAGNFVVPTNAGGEFRITGLTSGTYTVYYDAPSYFSQIQENIAVYEGQATVTPTAILVGTVGKIRGKVTRSNGKPVFGAAVKLNNFVTTTDAKGEFKFDSIPNGIYTIYYEATGHISQAQEYIAVSGGTTLVPTVIMMRQRGRLKTNYRRRSKSVRKVMSLPHWLR